MDRFSCETMVVSGVGALDILGESPCGKLLIAAQPEWIQGRQTDLILRAANPAAAAYFEIPEGIPTMKRAVEGSRKMKEFQPDLVAVLGDAGALALGKAMVCFSKMPCTLAVMPTAFGAGGEVTDRVTLTHNGHCHLLQDSRMRPDIAILDDGLPVETAGGKIAENGFALLAAALESYTAIQGGMLSDLHVREAFVSGWAALPAAAAGSKPALQRLRTASVLAGLGVGQTGLGLCRAMQNSLGLVFGLPPGKTAGILLPAVIGCNAHAAGRKYAGLSRAAGLGGSREEIGIRNLKSGLIRLRRELGLPGTLVQAGVDLRSIWNSSRRIVELTLEDPECRNNPVAADDFLVRRIIEEITGRI